MRIETLLILAVIVFFVFFKKKPAASNTSTTRDLPTREQESQQDGGAARALISEGIVALSGVIEEVFSQSEENTPPETDSYTIAHESH